MHLQEILSQNLSEEWKAHPLVVWGYQVLFADISEGILPATWTLPNVYCLLVSGSIQYYHAGRIRFGITGRIEPGNSFSVADTPDGLWLLIAARYGYTHKTDAVEQLKTAVGMMAAWGGRNAVYDRYFEFMFNPAKNQFSVSTPTILNPTAVSSPDFGRLSVLVEAGKAMAQLSSEQRSKVGLSLRWHSDSLQYSSVEAFLRLWIAFEVLAMTTSNVKSANNVLSNLYKIEAESAHKTMLTGQLQGLRSRIVHQGIRTSVHILVLDYVEAIYKDVLFFKLGCLGNRQADQILEKVSKELKEAIGAYQH